MIQSQLIKATATQTTPADPRLTLAVGGENGDLPSLDEVKAAFADAMAKAQRTDNAPSASQGSGEQSPLAGADAKSLATALDEPTAERDKPLKPQADEASLPPTDFLQQLQASLRQDVSLVVPPAGAVSQTVPLTTDGNSLPPESESAATPAAAPAVSAATPAAAPATSAAATPGSALTASLSQAALGEEMPVDAGEGADAAPSTTGQRTLASLQQEAPATETASSDMPSPAKGDKAALPVAEPPPLSAGERVAQLAKVLPKAEAVPLPEGGEPPSVGKAEKTIVSEQAAQGGPAAHTARTTPASLARAFGEGQSRVDIKAEAAPSAATPDADGSQPRPAAEGEAVKSSQRPAVKSDSGAAGAAGASAANGAVPVTVTPSPEPVLAAPQQILASHEPQGPQASLTALSAGIQQMEAEPAVAVKATAELPPLDVKQKLSELGKGAVSEAKAAESGETSPAVPPAQQPIQSAESKPAAEVAARREAQSLPHLKLATPEAPAQLHQKVNLMLADKLQQAEIQLDPLGLGKMKIQIQMGADNQANVHFVVQHGQTREMLEQAMPRLRDMMAGQGIQLGQTQVQQQAQQQGQPQSQGQSAFNGQGQQGQSEGGAFGGRDQTDGEVTTSTLSLLVESANDAGIDFYA